MNSLYAQEFTEETVMPPCETAAPCLSFPGCNVICNKTILRQSCPTSVPVPTPEAISGIFYVCNQPIYGWGQVAGTCEFYDNTPLDPGIDLRGSIGIFGANNATHRSEVPYVEASITPNTDYLFSYVRRTVSNVNVTFGQDAPLVATYTLEPTNFFIATKDWGTFPCVSLSQSVSGLPYVNSTVLLNDNNFGGTNAPFSWRQVVAAVRTGSSSSHNSLYCYQRRDNSPSGGYYTEIDHFEMIQDIFINDQTIVMTCNQTSVEIGDPTLCVNTDLLNMRYRWSQSTDGGSTWTGLFGFDNQTSITVTPNVTTLYRLRRYFPNSFTAPDGTSIPVTTVDGPINTVNREAIITVDPYYAGINNSIDIVLPAGATTWSPGTHPFTDFIGNAADPIRIAGTIRVSDLSVLTIDNLVFEFGSLGRILVEPHGRLILIGATLSGDANCNNMWQGIRTYGNNTSTTGGRVDTNPSSQSVIRDALIGISTQNLPIIDLNNIASQLISIPDFNPINNLTNLLFPDLWQMSVINSADGFLVLNNVAFENCFMGINTAWKPSHNDIIRGCNFNTTAAGLLFPFQGWITQGEAGIFSMFSKRLIMQWCTFNNLKYGVRTNAVDDLQIPNNSTAATETNIFTNCQVGISSRNFTSTAFPNVHIINNQFIGCNTAVQTQGSNARVFSNTISNGNGLSSVGILMMGSAYSIARNNQLSNVSRGIVNIDTDVLAGVIHGNTVLNTQVAIPNIGDNTSVLIQCNTLGNYQLAAISVAPWLTTTQTGILGNQGNCPLFVTPLNTFIPPAGGVLFNDIYLFPANTNLFQYSEYPAFLPAGFTASPGVLNPCGGGTPPGWDPVAICTQSSPRIADPENVKHLTDQKEQEMQTALWIQHYADQADTAALIDFLSELNNRVALRYRIQKHEQDANSAALLSLLNALTIEREEDEHYEYFYRLLLSLHETNRTIFDITSEEEAQLLIVAHSRTATAYKAQTFLYVTRGHEFVVNLPELDFINWDNWQTSFKTQTGTTVSKFYPNPAQNVVQLSYHIADPNHTNPTAGIYLYNAVGKAVWHGVLSGTGELTLRIDDFEEGLYYYEIWSDTEQKYLAKDKLVIIK